jgi:protein SCO1/2
MKGITMAATLAGAALTAALAAGATTVDAHAQHQHVDTKATAGASSVRVRFDDAVLTDQAGKARKLKSDVLSDRIVVMDFVYTTCTTICPILSANMARVQDGLDARAREEVTLVTISVDPARDTPARLREYGAKFGARAGWVWLTGPTGRVNEVLRGFDAYAPNFEDHPPQVLVGDARSGEWTRFLGFADPQAVLARVAELRAARDKPAHAGHKH